MKEINVLILSVGRRIELIREFRNAAKKLGIASRIVGVDISKSAPGRQFTDGFHIIPKVDDPNYTDAVIDVCVKENISLIVPTIDDELLILSENHEKVEKSTGAKLLLSSPKAVNICQDKNITQKFFEENGFLTPRQLFDDDIEKGNYHFPLFIKPSDGSASINIFKINNKKELDFFKEYIPNAMVQEFISGTEYSVDVFCDFSGKIITIVPRERIATRGGEITKGKIVKDREIIENVRDMINILKPVGSLTVQCIKTQRGVEYLEINPRFGGGTPMSIMAGANACENLYKLLIGEQLEYNENYEDNIYFARFDDCVKIKIED